MALLLVSITVSSNFVILFSLAHLKTYSNNPIEVYAVFFYLFAKPLSAERNPSIILLT